MMYLKILNRVFKYLLSTIVLNIDLKFDTRPDKSRSWKKTNQQQHDDAKKWICTLLFFSIEFWNNNPQLGTQQFDTHNENGIFPFAQSGERNKPN